MARRDLHLGEGVLVAVLPGDGLAGGDRRTDDERRAGGHVLEATGQYSGWMSDFIAISQARGGPTWRPRAGIRRWSWRHQAGRAGPHGRRGRRWWRSGRRGGVAGRRSDHGSRRRTGRPRGGWSTRRRRSRIRTPLSGARSRRARDSPHRTTRPESPRRHCCRCRWSPWRGSSANHPLRRCERGEELLGPIMAVASRPPGSTLFDWGSPSHGPGQAVIPSTRRRHCAIPPRDVWHARSPGRRCARVGGPVEERGHDLSPITEGTRHRGDLIGTFVDQQDDQVSIGVVGLQRADDLVHHRRLAARAAPRSGLAGLCRSGRPGRSGGQRRRHHHVRA